MKTVILSVVAVLGLSIHQLWANDILLEEKASVTLNHIDWEDFQGILEEDTPLVIDFTERVETVYVYDLQGNLLMAKTDKEGVQLQEVPYGAVLLMKDGQTHYYVLE